MICSKCGAQLASSSDTFCSICGAVAQPQQPVTAAAVPMQPMQPMQPMYPAPPHKKKSALPVALILLLVAAAAFSVWHFVLRDRGDENSGTQRGQIASQTADEDKPLPRAAHESDAPPKRDADTPPARESVQPIRLPNIFGGGSPDEPATVAPEPVESSTPEPESEPPTVAPEVVYPPPVFKYATASDVTTAAAGKDYSPSQALDGRPDTAWNVPGTGNEWIELDADTEQYVTGLRILSGYTKYSPEYNTWLYYRNHRPKNITLFFSDGTYLEWTLRDIFDEDNYIYQDILLDSPKLTTYIMIYIDSVYEGDRWDDICISEIEVY